MSSNYKILETKELPDSEIEIELEIDTKEVEKHRDFVIKKLNEQMNIPGFRKGHIPEKVISDRIGEGSLWEEQAEQAITDIVPEVVREKKIHTLGSPSITITKLAPGNPLTIKVKVALMPEVELPDYKEIARTENAKDKKAEEVTEKEIESVVEELQINFAEIDKKQEKQGEDKEKTDKKDPLPELNDDFAKKVGNFKNMEELKSRIKENLTKEKEYKAKEKNRIEIAESIIKGTKAKLPRVLIDSELSRMEAQFRADIERMGINFDDYLKHLKKSAEEIKKEWEDDARKRAMLQVIFNKIASDEDINPDKDLVEKEVAQIMEKHEDADIDRARIYVEMIMTNEKIFEFLEKQREL
ncbi:MAG: hypothetical protein COV70_03965 [Parcubacteria group bacterium CG11_big_fil_rev_8_21_14_0_20_39_22]|nr:MAG: hypothetical protein COV70_03965 [Parcubacteria group bacterium CG11_big_fil_rev_8_21_14_0_20_39_22]